MIGDIIEIERAKRLVHGEPALVDVTDAPSIASDLPQTETAAPRASSLIASWLTQLQDRFVARDRLPDEVG